MKKLFPFLLAMVLMVSLNPPAHAVIIQNPNGKAVNWQTFFNNQAAMIGILECLISGVDSSGNYSVLNRVWIQNDSLMVYKLDSTIFIGKLSGLKTVGNGLKKSGDTISLGNITRNTTISTDTFSIKYQGYKNAFVLNSLENLGAFKIRLDGFTSRTADTSLKVFSGNFFNEEEDLLRVPGSILIKGNPFGSGGEVYAEHNKFIDSIPMKLITATDFTNGTSYVINKNGFIIIPDISFSGSLSEYPFFLNNTIDNEIIKLSKYGDITYSGAIISTDFSVDTAGNAAVTAHTRTLFYDPNATVAASTFDLSEMQDGQEIDIFFGGTVTSGTVVTSLSFTGGSNTIIGGSTVTSGEVGIIIKAKRSGNKIYVGK